MQRHFILFTILTLIFTACQRTLKIPDSPYPISDPMLEIETVVDGFKIPYGLAIIGEYEYFITDRHGKFYHFKDENLNEIIGLPEVLTFGDAGIPFITHGGLMDVSVHPDYTNNAWIYVSLLGNEGKCKVARFKIEKNRVTDLATVFETKTSGYYGNGMRIVWEDDKHFFLNIGGSTMSTVSDPILISQDLNEDWGKIHRLNDDGSIPFDNPVLGGMKEPSTIWTYGHRDVQGLFYDVSSNVLFGSEQGPKGGDEFNIIEKGGNYGWPLFTYGIDYSGAAVSTITKDSAAKMSVLPEHFWTVPTSDGGQAISPACLLKVDKSNIVEWNDKFLIGSLAYRRLLVYNRETNETMGTNITGRVRTIKQLPSGDLIALVERNHPGKSNGYIVRISRV